MFESISSTGRLYNVYISVDSPDNANDVEDFVFDGYITPVNNGLIEYVTVSAGRTAYIAGTEPISGPITSMFVGSNNGTIKYSGVDFDEGLWENINLISTRPQGYDAALTAAVFVQTNTGLIEESYVQGYSNGESVATFDGMNGVGGFVYLNRGVIKNCAFELDLEIVGLQTYGNNGSYVGTFVAENEKFSSYENKIEYCDFDMTYGPDSVTLTVRNSAESLTFANIGGFVGRNDATIAECEITNFSIIVNDSTKPHIIGGFVATAQTINAGEISNSIVDYSTITAIIHEDGYVGGFFGYSAMTSNRFTNCSVKLEKNTEEGMFTVKSSNYGGFAGNNMTLGDTNIVGCTYSSTLAGTNSAIGGFRNVEGVTVAN